MNCELIVKWLEKAITFVVWKRRICCFLLCFVVKAAESFDFHKLIFLTKLSLYSGKG
jgi:hypothetical protein